MIWEGKMTTKSDKKPRRTRSIVLVIIGLVVVCLIGVIVIGGNSNKAGSTATPGSQAGVQATPAETQAASAISTNQQAPTTIPATSQPTLASSYKTGDVVTLQDQQITLNSISYAGGIVKANFIIENNSESEFTVSSMMSFTVKTEDGTKLDQSIMDCGTSFDGQVLPHDRLKGDICWNLSAASNIKIYYEQTMFSSGAIVWAISQNELKPAPVAKTTTPMPTTAASVKDAHKIGEVVELSDQRITLNSATISNKILKANFTIENTSTKDIDVSSMLSFEAKNGDGEKLDNNIFDCGTSLDGKIIAGDKLKGDICWNTGGRNDVKLYYQSNLFEGGTVFWVVK
jgi:hypothetical protein